MASSHLPAISEPCHVLHWVASHDCMQDADMKLCHVPAFEFAEGAMLILHALASQP